MPGVNTVSGLGGCGVSEEPAKSRDDYTDAAARNTDKEATYQVRACSWDQMIFRTLLEPLGML